MAFSDSNICFEKRSFRFKNYHYIVCLLIMGTSYQFIIALSVSHHASTTLSEVSIFCDLVFSTSDLCKSCLKVDYSYHFFFFKKSLLDSEFLYFFFVQLFAQNKLSTRSVAPKSASESIFQFSAAEVFHISRFSKMFGD